MPRLKMDDDEFDIEELENAEYDDTQYERYTGEIPPKDTVLAGYIKSCWLTETQAGDRMIKVLFVADGNEDDLEEYNGLPVWENLAMTAKSKFKWAPFFEYFGLTVKMFAKQTMLAEDDDNVGAPITKIGKWKPGEESPDARCAIVTTRERYNGTWSARVAEWVDLEEPEEEEEAPPPPRRSARTASGATSKRASGKSSASKPAGWASDSEPEEEDQEEPEEDDEEVEDEEEEEAPPPPARTRRAASGTSSARPATKSAAAAKPAGTKASAAKTSGTARAAGKAPARTAKAATRPARAKNRTASEGYDEEPPF